MAGLVLRSLLVSAAIFPMAVVAGCGGDEAVEAAGVECQPGESLVEGHCVGADAGIDAKDDVGPEQPDAGAEADAATADVTEDTSEDVTADVPEDTSTEASADVSEDVTTDVLEDTSTEASADASDEPIGADAAEAAVETGPGPCQSAQDCDDGIACSVDSCGNGVCKHWAGSCAAGQICDVQAGCVAAPPCATTAQCEQLWASDPCKTNIACDGATATCATTILDKDGDGHPPISCGGDDCNDLQKRIHPGQVDACNSLDDDCDGQVDDNPLEGDCCPAGPMFENCDLGCGGPSRDCETLACTFNHIFVPFSKLPVIIRTPSGPGVAQACTGCGPGNTVWGMMIEMSGTDTSYGQDALRVTVSEPWEIGIESGVWGPYYCDGAYVAGQCTVSSIVVDTAFTVITQDPDAPARNILIERVQKPGVCP